MNLGKFNPRFALAASLMLFPLMPVPAYASPVTVLKYIVAGVAVIADFGGATETLSNIFKGSSLNDDNPLYSSSTSPSLTISATETTFDLLLKQPNDVSIFEDDFIAEISGITQVATDKGDTNAWAWRVTIEADMFGPIINWDVGGEVRHLLAPHPDEGEKKDAPAIGYDLNIDYDYCDKAPCLNKLSTVKDKDLRKHNDGQHWDQLTSASFELMCCNTTTLGFITADFFNVHLEALHTATPTVPEPSTWAILVSGIVLLFLIRQKQRTVRLMN